MYKLPTNNLNYAYDFAAIYNLKLPTGKRKEKIVSKRVTSAWQLSGKEIQVIGDVWRADTVNNFAKKFNNPEIKLDYFEVEWSVVDQNGKYLGFKG